MKQKSSLVQSRYSLSGFDLVQSKSQSKTASQLFNATHMGRGSVQIWPLILYQLIKELREDERRHRKKH